MLCVCVGVGWVGLVFFFRAEEGICGAQESRGLGDVYMGEVVIACSSDILC